uniref:PHD-type domain-containing protein n=1 Tax=Anopheles maculatus TaxID=74869 RepID=A0A182STF6_9DIPT
MAKLCSACAVEIGDNFISCYLCDSPFHHGCAAIPSDALKCITDNKQVHWCCVGCNGVISNPRQKRIKEVLVQSSINAAMSQVADGLKAAVEPLAKEIHAGFTLLNDQRTLGSPLSSRISPLGNSAVPVRKRRRLYADISRTNTPDATTFAAASTNTFNPSMPLTQNHSNEVPAVITGTNQEISPSLVVVPRIAYCWVHLSGLPNSTTPELISSYVKRRLDTDDVLAFCLIKKGVDASSLRSYFPLKCVFLLPSV